MRTSVRVLPKAVVFLLCFATFAPTALMRAAPPAVQGTMADKRPPPMAIPVSRPWTGDFDGLVKRRAIRILTPYSRTHYFIDKGVQRGIVYEAEMLLEREITAPLKTTPATKIHVAVVPTTRDALHQALVEGRGDIVAANITITPVREKLVDERIAAERVGREPVQYVSNIYKYSVAYSSTLDDWQLGK